MSSESHHHDHAGPPDAGRGPGYEVRDTSVKAVVSFLVGLMLFLIVAQVFLWGMLRAISSDRPPSTGPLGSPELLSEQLRKLRYGEDVALGLAKTRATPPAGRLTIRDAIDRLSETGIAPVAPRTEAEVNSHAGAPAKKKDESRDKDKDKDSEKGKDAPGEKGR